MENLKQEFEAITGIQIKDLNEVNLEKILKDETNLGFIGTNLFEILSILETENSNEIVKNQFRVTALMTKIIFAEKAIGKIFSENEEEPEKIIELTNQFLKENPEDYSQIIAYLGILSSNVRDISEEEKESMKASLNSFLDKVNSFNMESAIEAIGDMLDILYSFRAAYFENFEEDLLINSPVFNEIFEKYETVTEPIYKAMLESMMKEEEDKE